MLYAEVTADAQSPMPVSYADTGIAAEKPFHYRFRAIGLDGAKTRFSQVVSGQMPFVDCHGNTIRDLSDVQDGTSEDVNGNFVPDECEHLRCEGDGNGDDVVDPLDVGFVQARLCCPVGTGDADCDAADANGDGTVDPLDVGYVQARFGACN